MEPIFKTQSQIHSLLQSLHKLNSIAVRVEVTTVRPRVRLPTAQYPTQKKNYNNPTAEQNRGYLSQFPNRFDSIICWVIILWYFDIIYVREKDQQDTPSSHQFFPIKLTYTYKSYCSNVHFCRITSIHQPTNAHIISHKTLLKHFKTPRHVSIFQININWIVNTIM